MESSDEDVPTCPLCLEELDSTDRAVKACHCGYQVCLWCLNTLRQQHNGRCPACRTPYEETKFTIQEMNPQQAKREARERANAKKEREKRMKARELEQERARAEALALRRAHTNLKHARIEQRNLIYVMNLSLTLAREEVLKRPDMFGKFGRITRVLINKSQPYNADAPRGPSISAYIQYQRESEAAAAARQMNGVMCDGREIRCSIATVKYCDSYIARASKQPNDQVVPYPVTCGNPDCLYYHEPALPSDVLTIEDVNTRQLGPPPPPYLFHLRRRHVTAKGVITRPVGMSPPSMRPTRTGTGPPSIGTQDDLPEPPSQMPSSQSMYRVTTRAPGSTLQGMGKRRNSSYQPQPISSRGPRSLPQSSTINQPSTYQHFSAGPIPSAQTVHQSDNSSSGEVMTSSLSMTNSKLYSPLGRTTPMNSTRGRQSPKQKPRTTSTWTKKEPRDSPPPPNVSTLQELLAKIGGGRGNGDSHGHANAPKASFVPAGPIIGGSNSQATPPYEAGNVYAAMPASNNLQGVPIEALTAGVLPGRQSEGQSRFHFAQQPQGSTFGNAGLPNGYSLGGPQYNLSPSDLSSSGQRRSTSSTADDAAARLLSLLDKTDAIVEEKPKQSQTSTSILGLSSDFERMSVEEKLASIFDRPSPTPTPNLPDSLKIENLNELKGPYAHSKMPTNASQGISRGTANGTGNQETSESENDTLERGNFLGESLAGKEQYDDGGDRKLKTAQRRKQEKKARQKKRDVKGGIDKTRQESMHNNTNGTAGNVDHVVKASGRIEELMMTPGPSNGVHHNSTMPLAAFQSLDQRHGELERTRSMTDLEQQVQAAREREAMLQSRLSELQQRIRKYGDNIRT